jgi:hypothetical protein
VLAISCVISYWLITHILAQTYSISGDDNLLGGMWAVAATIFVYRYSHAESVRAALSRMAATFVSFALCLVYLLIFPFHVWGMAALIGIGAIVVTTMGHPDDTIMRIPMMSISQTDLMPIRSERSDARLSQCEIVIGISQEFYLFSFS